MKNGEPNSILILQMEAGFFRINKKHSIICDILLLLLLFVLLETLANMRNIRIER